MNDLSSENLYPQIRSAQMPLSAPPIARIYGAIRERYRAGESIPELALDYGMSIDHAERVIRATEVLRERPT